MSECIVINAASRRECIETLLTGIIVEHTLITAGEVKRVSNIKNAWLLVM